MTVHFFRTPWTTFHITKQPYVAWTSRDGMRLYFRVENRTIPLAMVAASGKTWYARTHPNNSVKEKSIAYDTMAEADDDAIYRVLAHGPVPRPKMPDA